MIQKEQLTEEMKEIFPEKKNKMDLTTKIGRFLLNPEIIPLLEE